MTCLKFTRGYLFYMGILVILAVIAKISYAETKISTVYKNYTISGNNINDIQQAVMASSIKNAEGHGFAAKTNFNISWKYNFGETEYGCFIKSVDVDLKFTYLMPELINYTQLDAVTKNEWRRFYTATKIHEYGHVNITKDATRRIEWELSSILPKGTCEEISRTANMLANNILQNQDRANLAYDIATNHGMGQGAVLMASK